MTRPLSPPIALPAMYKPIAWPREPRSTSSARYAIAVAGTPARASPCRTRMATSAPSDGASGAIRPSTAAASAEIVMTRRRPSTSDRELTGMIASARAPVPADMARLAAAGVARNDAASIGSSGCGG